MSILFNSTNENLDAIVKGMKIRNKDCVLAICGAGDQGIAMALKGAYVVLVDNDASQLEYAKSRYYELYQGNIEAFCFTEIIEESWISNRLFGENEKIRQKKIDAKNRDNYFKRRSKSLREKKLDVTFLEGDIFNQDPKNFNKIYLSNVRDTHGIDRLINDSISGTMFYLCDESNYRKLAEKTRLMTKIDTHLTAIAKKYEKIHLRYSPIVFLKI